MRFKLYLGPGTTELLRHGGLGECSCGAQSYVYPGYKLFGSVRAQSCGHPGCRMSETMMPRAAGIQGAQNYEIQDTG